MLSADIITKGIISLVLRFAWCWRHSRHTVLLVFAQSLRKHSAQFALCLWFGAESCFRINTTRHKWWVLQLDFVAMLHGGTRTLQHGTLKLRTATRTLLDDKNTNNEHFFGFLNVDSLHTGPQSAILRHFQLKRCCAQTTQEKNKESTMNIQMGRGVWSFLHKKRHLLKQKRKLKKHKDNPKNPPNCAEGKTGI